LRIFDSIENFIFPIFIYENELTYEKNLKLPYLNDSKVFIGHISHYMQKLVDLNITNILIFGVPKRRNPMGTTSYLKNGVVQTSIRRIKENFGNKINVISDVCICQYNISGHCGLFNKRDIQNKYITGKKTSIEIDNDKTLKTLGKIALSLSESGTDFIAPSSMMDGQVTYLKKILEKGNFNKVKIMSYSSKHNSCLYSPFRSNNFFKSVCIDKSSYQNSYNNLHESIREIILDINEGADWVMIKPSLWYMDIVQMVKRYIDKPLVVQNVSGEYALLEAMSKKKWFDEIEWITLSLLSIKRAGADKIISYFILKLLRKLLES